MAQLVDGKNWTGEFLVQRRDGNSFPALVSNTPIYQEEKLVGVIGISMDITERRRAEQGRRFLSEASVTLASSLDYRATLNKLAQLAIPTLGDWCFVHILDNDGTVQEVAYAHQDMKKAAEVSKAARNYPPQPNTKSPVWQVLETGKSEFYPEITDAMVVGRARDTQHLEFLRAVGFASLIIVPMIARGRTLGAIQFVLSKPDRRFDNADLALAEELAHRAAIAVDNASLYQEARDQRERLQISLSSIGDAVIATDAQGHITFMNAVAESLTGWSQVDSQGMALHQVFHIMDEVSRQPLENPVVKVMRDGTVVGLANHTILVSRDGKEFHIDNNAAPIRHESGAIVGVILVFHDVTERWQAQRLAHENSERLRVALLPIDMAVFNQDHNLRYTWMYQPQLGFSVEQIVGKTDSDLLPPQSVERINQIKRQVLETNTGTRQEVSIITNDQTLVYDLIVEPLRNTAGHVIGITGASVNITERKHTEEQLQFQAHLLNMVGQAIISTDPYGKIIYWNRFAETLYGWTSEEAVGQNAAEIIVTERSLAQGVEIMARVKQGQSWSGEYIVQHRNGVPFPAQVHLAPVYDNEGKFIAIIGASTDITERKKYEEALHKLSMAIEQTADSVMISDVLGVIEYVNQTFERDTGISKAEAIGQQPYRLRLGNYSIEHYEEIAKTVIADNVFHDVFTNRRRNGEVYYEDVTVSTVKNAAGIVTHFVSTGRDITERKRAEQEIAESQRFLRSTLDALSENVAILDETGSIVTVNASWKNFADANGLGDPTYGIGSNYLDICDAAHGDDAAEASIVAVGIREVLAGESEVFTAEYPCHSATEQRWFRLTVTRFREAGPIRLVVTHENMTVRKQIEIALRASEAVEREQRAFAEALRHTASVLIGAIDSATVMARVLENVQRIGSPSAAMILIIEDDQARFTHWNNLPDDAAALFKGMELPLTVPLLAEMLTRLETVVVPDSAAYPGWIIFPELKWIRSFVATPIISQGVLFGFLVLVSPEIDFFDSAYIERLQAFADQAALAMEKAHLYDELRQHASELEQRVKLRTAELQVALEKERELSELKTRFISMASHEFRTPLATIQITVDALRIYWDKMLPEDRAKRFERVNGQIEHMTGLLEDVLTIGRAASGALEFNPRMFDLKSLCKEIVEQLRPTTLTHKLHFVYSSDIVQVWGDRKLLQLAIANLISNAIKYSPEKEQIDIRLIKDETRVLISIQDQGIGIPAKDLQYLFEPFHRSSNVGAIAGTGLGLAIVKHAVDLHSGQITVQSDMGAGSTFTICLPVPTLLDESINGTVA
jgi:PAS domain S-box-containing protein